MSRDELWRMSATDAVAALKGRDLRPTELIEAAIDRTGAVDGSINALPIRCFERALEQAGALEANGAGDDFRNLSGLPIAVKDYNDVGGVKTTYGSPIYADNVPQDSDTTVATLEARSAALSR